MLARSKDWARRNPERVQFLHRNIEARKRARGKTGTITKAEWAEVLDVYGHRCAYCGRGDVKLAMDHITDLDRGGPHIAENVAPACKPCNSRKKNRGVLYMVNVEYRSDRAA